MRQIILFCNSDNYDTCPALFFSGDAKRPFAITDETDPRGTVFLSEAELDTLATEAPSVQVVHEDGDVTIIGSDSSRIMMTSAYFQRLTNSLRDGSTRQAIAAATV